MNLIIFLKAFIDLTIYQLEISGNCFIFFSNLKKPLDNKKKYDWIENKRKDAIGLGGLARIAYKVIIRIIVDNWIEDQARIFALTARSTKSKSIFVSFYFHRHSVNTITVKTNPYDTTMNWSDTFDKFHGFICLLKRSRLIKNKKRKREGKRERERVNSVEKSAIFYNHASATVITAN